MEKFVLIICVFAIFISCKKSDDPVPNPDVKCGGFIDFSGPPSFSIALVDNDGNNLIENDIFKAAEISASVNGLITENDVVQSDLIILHPISFLKDASEVETDYRWLLKLSSTDTDTLDYFLSFEEVKTTTEDILLCGTQVILDSANYNGMPFDIKKDTVYSTLPFTVIKVLD